jgi:hypothetical protein
LTLVSLSLGSATAEQIPAQKPDVVEGHCGESGGVHFPKTGPNSTYGCINEDGSGIVCGGVTAKDKRTCDTFAQTPPRLPTRWEAGLAEKAKVQSRVRQGK